MKYLFFSCLIANCVIISCNSKRPSAETKEGNSDSATAIYSNGENQETEEELQNLSPYTAEQMKALLPAELEGAKLSQPVSGKVTGTAYAKGTYEINDSVMIEVSLFDCGGNGGAGFYKYQFLNMLNIEPEGEDEEVKVTDFNGGNAIEHYDYNSYRSTFTYFDYRFLITLESESMDMKGLKKIAAGLKLK